MVLQIDRRPVDAIGQRARAPQAEMVPFLRLGFFGPVNRFSFVNANAEVKIVRPLHCALERCPETVGESARARRAGFGDCFFLLVLMDNV
jgi:hypothetical protein